MTIARSTGIPVAGWCGPLPGGGYEGRTRKLDRAVAGLAKWIGGKFGLDVQIRFNSDRLSGGAFVCPLGKPGFGAPDIGLTAALFLPESVQRTRGQVFSEGNLPPRLEDLRWDEGSLIRYAVLIYPQFLADPDDLGRDRGSFGWWRADTAREAKRILLRRIRTGLVVA